MKNLIIFIFAALLLLPACKPNEAAYRSAYESAIKKRDNDTVGGAGKIEGTIFNRYRDLAMMQPLIVGNDTLPMVTEYVGYTKDGGATRETLHTYNIVVGRFKQIFNATQMRERLMSGNYPGAFILHTREPLYYVVAASESTAQGALEQMRRIEADSTLHLRAPLPFVLRPAHMKR